MENTISHDFIENRTVYPKIEVKEDKPMTITATEFKKNLGKYLKIAEKEDVLITKNGKTTIVLKNAKHDIAIKLAALESLVGIANPEGKQYTDEEIDEMRFQYLVEKHGNIG